MDDANEAMTVPQKEQNAGVALLLERMKTNPEEFTEHGKWGSLIHSHKMFLSEEDCKALDAGINALMQQHFTEKVLEELVDPKSMSHNDYNPLKDIRLGGATQGGFLGVRNTGAVTGTISTGGTWGTSSIALETQHMEAHKAYLEKLVKEAGIKNHQTLFGKLKNYISAD